MFCLFEIFLTTVLRDNFKPATSLSIYEAVQCFNNIATLFTPSFCFILPFYNLSWTLFNTLRSIYNIVWKCFYFLMYSWPLCCRINSNLPLPDLFMKQSSALTTLPQCWPLLFASFCPFTICLELYLTLWDQSIILSGR